MQQGVPKSLNISDDKPPSIRGYRRATVHMSTTQSEYKAGSQCLVPFDTGIEGTFLDLRTLRLVFTVTVTNHNRYIDFISLGRAGAASFIEEISFEVNGVPIERNLQYPAVVELEKIRAGEAMDPFLMTFENPWEPAGGAAGVLHKNFIKPPMVNAAGQAWDALFAGQQLYNLFPELLTCNRATADFVGTVSVSTSTTRYPDFPAGNAGSFNKYLLNFQQGFAPYTTVESGVAMGGPRYCPTDYPKLQAMVQANRAGRRDLKQTLAEGANIKYLPVHHRPADANWLNEMHFINSPVADTQTVCAMDDTKGTSHQFQFSLELYMGVVGRNNPKWLPTLAIGAGRAQFRIKFARVEQAFTVSMDPNRRIPNTLRDCAPFRCSATDSGDPNTYGEVWPSCDISIPRSAVSQGVVLQATPSGVGNYTLLGLANTLPAGTALTDAQSRAVPCALNAACCLGQFPSLSVYVNASADAYIAALNDDLANQQAHIVNGLPGACSPGDGVQATASGWFTYACPPVCQYGVYTDPLTARARNSTVAYATEANRCFGTHLVHGRPQARRTHRGALPLGIPQLEQMYGITYAVSNIQIRGEEILFSDAIVDSLLAAGVAGNAVMETMIYKETKVQLQKASTQRILIPISAASIVDLCCAFRHRQQLTGEEALSQPTYSFINPFMNLKYTPSVTNTVVKGVDTLTIESPWSSASSLGINLQFQLGSEFLPRLAIDSVSALSDFVCQGDQIFYGAGELGNYRQLGQQPERMDIFAEYVNQVGTNPIYPLQALSDGYFCPFVPTVLLDDQTVTCNPFLGSANGGIETLVGRVLLPLYEPPVGTFHISLNMETMMGHGHKTRSGSTIVNNQLYLRMDKANACADSDLEMIVYARCNAKIVFERGGSMQVIS